MRPSLFSPPSAAPPPPGGTVPQAAAAAAPAPAAPAPPPAGAPAPAHQRFSLEDCSNFSTSKSNPPVFAGACPPSSFPSLQTTLPTRAFSPPTLPPSSSSSSCPSSCSSSCSSQNPKTPSNTPSLPNGQLPLSLVALLSQIVQCQVCTNPLYLPITLPCGYTICTFCYNLRIMTPHGKSCSPSSQTKDGRESSRQSPHETPFLDCFNREDELSVVCTPPDMFECPVPSCRRLGRQHCFRDYSVDVTVHRIMDLCFPDESAALALVAEAKRIKEAESPWDALPYLNKSIEMSKHLQMPWLVRALAQASLRNWKEAWRDVHVSLMINPACPISKAVRADVNRGRLCCGGMRWSDLDDPVPESTKAAVSASRSRCSSTRAMDLTPQELECNLCCHVMEDPVTAPCGHSWCRSCVLESLNHQNSCPLCRRLLPPPTYFRHRPSNKILSAVISGMNLPEECTKAPHDSQSSSNPPFGFSGNSASAGAAQSPAMETTMPTKLLPSPCGPIRDNRFIIPIFVGTLVFPGVPIFMHIFERRYRDMLQWCMDEGGCRFGMCLPSPTKADPNCSDADNRKGFSLVSPGINGDVEVPPAPPPEDSQPTPCGPEPYRWSPCQNYLEYGTLLRIKTCQPVEDCSSCCASLGESCPHRQQPARYFLHAVGESRFRVIQKATSAAGYNVALVERIDDLEPEDEDEEMESIAVSRCAAACSVAASGDDSQGAEKDVSMDGAPEVVRSQRSSRIHAGMKRSMGSLRSCSSSSTTSSSLLFDEPSVPPLTQNMDDSSLNQSDSTFDCPVEAFFVDHFKRVCQNMVAVSKRMCTGLSSTSESTPAPIAPTSKSKSTMPPPPPPPARTLFASPMSTPLFAPPLSAASASPQSQQSNDQHRRQAKKKFHACASYDELEDDAVVPDGASSMHGAPPHNSTSSTAFFSPTSLCPPVPTTTPPTTPPPPAAATSSAPPPTWSSSLTSLASSTLSTLTSSSLTGPASTASAAATASPPATARAALYRRLTAHRHRIAERISRMPEAQRRHFTLLSGRIPREMGALTFWLASLMPVGEYARYPLLAEVAVCARAAVVLGWLEDEGVVGGEHVRAVRKASVEV